MGFLEDIGGLFGGGGGGSSITENTVSPRETREVELFNSGGEQARRNEQARIDATSIQTGGPTQSQAIGQSAAPIVQGAVDIISGAGEARALESQIQALREAASAEADSYKKAQLLLQKSKLEAITDLEAANLKVEGLITDAEEAQITSLNQTEAGAVDTLKTFYDNADNIYATTKELLAKEIVDAGLLEQGAIDEGALTAIENLGVFSTKITQGLKEFADTAKQESEISQENIAQGALSAIDKVASSNELAKQGLGKYKEELIKAGLQSREGIDQTTKEEIARILNTTAEGVDEVIAGNIDAAAKLIAGKEGAAEKIISGNAEGRAALEDLKKNIVDRGFITREELNTSVKDGIKAVSGATAEAVESLTPFQLAGQRGLERVQFLSGLLTPEERESHLATFGDVESSPLFKYRVQEREKQLDRRQKSAGRIFSGAGLEEFRSELDKLTAEETQRQLDESRGLATSGQAAAGQIAGLQQQRGLAEAGLIERGASQIAGQRAGEGAALGQADRGLAEVGIREGEALGALETGTAAQQAQLAARQGEQTAGLRARGAEQAAAIGTRGQEVLSSQRLQEAGIGADIQGKIAALEQQTGLSIGEIQRTLPLNQANELYRQLGITANVANTIANIENQTGTNISGIQQQRGKDIGQAISTQAGRTTNLGLGIAQQQAQAQQGLGQQLGNIGLSVGEARRSIRENSALNQAKQASAFGTNVANIRTGSAAQQVGLSANQARQQSQFGIAQGQLQSQQQAAQSQGLLNAGALGLKLLTGLG